MNNSSIYQLSFIDRLKVELDKPLITPSVFEQKYIQSIDGLRAMSVTIVFFFHAKDTEDLPEFLHFLGEYFFFGAFGVHIFFAISGFLITGLLLKEKVKTGKINLLSFYWRRSVRIFPVLYAYLLVLFALTYFYDLGTNNFMFISTALYLQNFGFYGGTWVLGHMWSLSVEEQFYLIWPSLLMFAKRFKYLPFIFTASVVLLCPIISAVVYLRPTYSYVLLAPILLNIPLILFGALAAFCLYKGWFNSIIAVISKPVFGLSIVLAWLMYLPKVLLILAPFTVPFSNVFGSFFISIFILHIITIPKETILYRVLNYPLIIYIGKLSYSIYIWQQLFLIPSNVSYHANVWWAFFPLNMLMALTVAIFSYHFVEQPLLKFKKLL